MMQASAKDQTRNVLLSLGSNVGDREANLRDAITRLESLGVVVKASAFYETEPVDYLNQPWFLNCVVQLDTTLSAEVLLERLLEIERAMGRKRLQPKGPRLIDIDILLFGDRVINQPGLTIPHPAMHQRRFVLDPLVEIAPEAVHPVLHRTVKEIQLALPLEGPVVRRLATK